MKWSIRCLTGVALLISALSTASAQTWSYGDYGPRVKGCYETPYDGGPQYAQRAVATNTAIAPAIATPVRRPTSTTASIARIRQAFQCPQ